MAKEKEIAEKQSSHLRSKLTRAEEANKAMEGRLQRMQEEFESLREM